MTNGPLDNGQPNPGPPPVTVLEGRLARKLNNALTMTFRAGPGDPIGQAVQSGADGAGSKLGILFGFKNGGPGVHVYTPAQGAPIHVASRELEPTVLTREDGTVVATVERGDVSVARTPDGAEVLRWMDDPDGGKTLEAFRIAVVAPDGELVARLNVIRTVAGWSLGRDVVETAIWWGHAGQPMKLPLLGTSAQVLRPLSPLEHEVLVASCVDLAIGMRPYSASTR